MLDVREGAVSSWPGCCGCADASWAPAADGVLSLLPAGGTGDPLPLRRRSPRSAGATQPRGTMSMLRLPALSGSAQLRL